jgi:hypothetical protein
VDLSPRLFPPLELPARRAIDLALRPSMIYALAPQKISALNSALGCFWRLMFLLIKNSLGQISTTSRLLYPAVPLNSLCFFPEAIAKFMRPKFVWATRAT